MIGFMKTTAGFSPGYCITNSYLFFTQNQKYQPIGKTSDLINDLKSNLTVEPLVVTGSTLTGTCSGGGKSY